MELAEGMGVKVKEQALTRYDLWIADECFLTGTAAEVIPSWKWTTARLEMEAWFSYPEIDRSFRKCKKRWDAFGRSGLSKDFPKLFKPTFGTLSALYFWFMQGILLLTLIV